MDINIAAATDGVAKLGNILFASLGAETIPQKRASRLARALEIREKDKARNLKMTEILHRARSEARRQQFAEKKHADDLALKDRQLQYRQERDEALSDERRREQHYRRGKDWINDFYRRNEIYMKTGLRVPDNFTKLLKSYIP